MTTPKKGHQLLLIDPSLDDSSSDSEVLITENADALTSTNSNHQILLIDPSLDDSSSDSDDFEDAKADYQSRQKDDPADDLQSSDNFIDFKCDEEFRRDIGLDSIKEKLRLLESDITKTEYSIVIAGEICSGKSTIINLILGETVLPTGITAHTQRVCRVKYFERCMISTRNSQDEELENMSFETLNEMTKKLKTLATINDEEISYVDIYIPVPFLQGNVMIVETNGSGFHESSEKADKTIAYFQNAVAFVFVLNVANPCGIHDEKHLQTISKVRESINGMKSFSTEDVIILLNKWDVISYEDAALQEEFYEDSKAYLHEVFEAVNDSYILKFSATKVKRGKKKYISDFEMFQESLKDVITRNKNKWAKAQLRSRTGVLDEYNRALLTKVDFAKENANENQTKLDELATELKKLENTRKEEISKIEVNIETLIDKTAHQFKEYIHQWDFRVAVLTDTDKLSRLTIGNELDIRIEKESIAWLEKNIDGIFQETVLNDLKKKFENIHKTLHSIKDNLTGIKTHFDVDNIITRVFASDVIQNGAFLLAHCMRNSIVLNIAVRIGIATAGILSGIFISSLDIVEFDVVREKAFQVRLNAFTKENIKGYLRKKYFFKIKEIISAFLEGDLENEIIKIKENITRMKTDHDYFDSEEKTLTSLQLTIIQKIESLQQNERVDKTTE